MTLRIRWLGRVPYREAWALQRAMHASSPDDHLLLLEHREGHAIAVLLAYKKKRLRRGVEFGDLAAAPGAQQVWRG